MKERFGTVEYVYITELPQLINDTSLLQCPVGVGYTMLHHDNGNVYFLVCFSCSPVTRYICLDMNFFLQTSLNKTNTKTYQ